MTLNQELLAEIIPLVEKKIARQREETGPYDVGDYSRHEAWRRRDDAATERLKAFFAERYLARFSQRAAHDHVVKMAGIRAASTGGWIGAMQNWKRAAEKKVAAR